MKEARDQNAYAHGHAHISGYVKANYLDASAAVKLVYTEFQAVYVVFINFYIAPRDRHADSFFIGNIALSRYITHIISPFPKQTVAVS
jgi:hypothetical protein